MAEASRQVCKFTGVFPLSIPTSSYWGERRKEVWLQLTSRKAVEGTSNRNESSGSYLEIDALRFIMSR